VEASKSVRERLAGESRNVRCSGCGGRSNAEIIKEVEEAAREAGKEKEEEKVPEELRLGYKDELESKGEKGKEREGPVEGEEGAGRSEVTTNGAAVASVASPLPIGGPVAAPDSSPVPTRTTATTPQAPVAPLAVAAHSQAYPEWIDKAIVGVAIALAFMLLKKFLAAS